MSTMLDAALRYSSPDHFTKSGLSVFPVRFMGGSKLSYVSAKAGNGNSWGFSRDKHELQDYWRRWPKAGIGLPTGAVNGIFVLDVDTKAGGHKHDGMPALLQLERENATLFARRATSPTGGLHLYFQMPGGGLRITSREIVPGIDVKGDGGFIVAPPTVRPGKGSYEWLHTIGGARIRRAPQWLIDIVAEIPRVARSAPVSNIDPASCDPMMLAAMQADSGMGISRDVADNLAPEDLHLKIRCALAVIDNSIDNRDYFRVGLAIYNALSDRGSGLFFDFTERLSGERGSRRAQMDYKWTKQFPKCSDTVTAATIFAIADSIDRDWRDIYRRLQAVAEVQL
jgi:hypothetical protein